MKVTIGGINYFVKNKIVNKVFKLASKHKVYFSKNEVVFKSYFSKAYWTSRIKGQGVIISFFCAIFREKDYNEIING